MARKVRIGFEVPTGEEVETRLRHLVTAAITESGKTTALESWNREEVEKGGTSVVFLTKKGEEEFTDGVKIPPYFREEINWEYVKDILETVMDRSMDFKESWIIDAVDTSPYPDLEPANTLEEVQQNIKTLLEKDLEDDSGVKLNGLTRSVYTSLDKYFEKLIPKIEQANFSTELEIEEGRMNIMDLRHFDRELQSMIIARSLETIYKDFTNIRVVIPEAWKFLPQRGSSIVKKPAIQLIREGGTNDNYLTIDSQDITPVDKEPLKQVKQWALGLQMEKNEVERTREQMPLPKKKAPSKEEIMGLQVGHFYFCEARETGGESDRVRKVYVKPVWMDEIEYKGLSGDELAKAIAQEEISSEDLREAIEDGEIEIPSKKIEEQEEVTGEPDNSEPEDSSIDYQEQYKKMKDRVSNLEEMMEGLKEELHKAEQELEQKEEQIEKMGEQKEESSAAIDKVLEATGSKNSDASQEKQIQHDHSEIEEKIDELRREIPSRGEIIDIVERKIKERTSNAATKGYVDQAINNIELPTSQSQPADNIKDEILADFQEEAITKVVTDASKLKSNQKKLLIFLESRGSRVSSKKKWVKGALGWDSYGSNMKQEMDELVEKGFVRKDNGNNYYGQLEKKIEKELEPFNPSDKEVEDAYHKALAKLNKVKTED